MKKRTPRRARRSTAQTIKIVCVLFFCAFTLLVFASQMPRASEADNPTATNFTAPSDATMQAENRAPEFFRVLYNRVGTGQRIFFGLEVIDEESDDVRVEVIEKPASARYNERTLTIRPLAKVISRGRVHNCTARRSS